MEPAHGGIACPELLIVQICNSQDCPVDCDTSWLPWLPCSKECGQGTQSRRIVHTEVQHGCAEYQHRFCDTNACPSPPINSTQLPSSQQNETEADVYVDFEFEFETEESLDYTAQMVFKNELPMLTPSLAPISSVVVVKLNTTMV